jgi:hypothetical protein
MNVGLVHMSSYFVVLWSQCYPTEFRQKLKKLELLFVCSFLNLSLCWLFVVLNAHVS